MLSYANVPPPPQLASAINSKANLSLGSYNVLSKPGNISKQKEALSVTML